MTDGVQQTTTSEQVAASFRLLGRDRLARLVVVGSFLTIFLLVGILLVLAQQEGEDKASEAATNAFNAILPVLSGWVGTVLAFYFSAASQERTNATLDKMLGRSGDVAGDGTLVTAKMIPLASVRKLQQLSNERSPEKIPLTELKAAFDDKEQGPVTRLLFTENGVFRYILHIGEFNAFLQKNAIPDKAEKSGTESTEARTIDQLTFRDMLQDPDTLHTISKLVVFVPSSATIADAQAALGTISGAKDIFVTATGNASVPVLGWLSDTDLTKAL